MSEAFYLLLLIGHLGAFDVLYFHMHRCGLARRPECQREVLWHTIRHLVYAGQFLAVAHLRFHGWALLLLGALYAADVFVAWADVWEETRSRRPQGGLPRGEYFMHVVLSVLVGIYLASVARAAWPDRLLETAIVYAPPEVPRALRALMTLMGISALAFGAHDFVAWLRFGKRAAPKRVVVTAFVPAPVQVVWERTQTPEEHVRWDIRFTDIAYRTERDERGFELLDYATRFLGVSVRGVGRYLQNAPLERSTFEFESRDWKALIRRGRGLWCYASEGSGTCFETVYDYEVRYGALGRAIDALLFRPLIQLATEWGFETLRLWCAGDEGALERRASRLRFAGFFIWRRLGAKPTAGSARSWLGSGTKRELVGAVA
jgi:hypothetical protein